MTRRDLRELVGAMLMFGASLGCGEAEPLPVGGACSQDPRVIRCEELLSGAVRGDHPRYWVFYDADGLGCRDDDVACYAEATGIPRIEVRGYDLFVSRDDLPALCRGSFGPRISSLSAEVDWRCLQLGSDG